MIPEGSGSRPQDDCGRGPGAWPDDDGTGRPGPARAVGDGWAETLERLPALAARLLGAPAAFLSTAGGRSFHGPAARWDSLVAGVSTGAVPGTVEDAVRDPRVDGHRVADAVPARAWLSCPLLDRAGRPVGCRGVIDTRSRSWTAEDVEVLGTLSRLTARAAPVDRAAGGTGAAEAAERLRRLTGAAMQLAGAETMDDLTRIVVNQGLAVLGADGGAVAVREEPDHLRLAVSDRLGEQVQVTYGLLPLDSPLPAAYTARTGERVLLPTQASGLAFAPETAEVYADTRRNAWAVLPLRVETRLLGALVVSWVHERRFADDEIELLEGFAAQCALALDRIGQLQARRRAALAAQRLSETLQRSLLTQPPTPDALQIAVGYQPAAEEAQVGGDWYDAFVTAAGATLLVIGDVVGHDRIAAAAMGQVRNLLRGLAYDSDDSPAVLLTRLDRALRGLEVGALATAVVARVEQDTDDQARQVRRLRWSNAGHLPPLLRHPDGTVEVLDSGHNLLLGVDPDRPRTDQVVELTEDATLLLYTDGLVERRHTSVDAGITRLIRQLAAIGARPPQRLCADILAAGTSEAREDDVAVLVMRCGPTN